ncbi:MAG: hypothetical protein H6Q73_1220 [Firmicutes bacterium]|nr:hypothetical protein [Bacillota bacterium]
MKNLPRLFFISLFIFMVTTLPASAMAEHSKTVDLTAKIDNNDFWAFYYSTAFGGQNSLTLSKIKNVIVEIKSGNTILSSFTFTSDGEQSHHFILTTIHNDIIIHYRAITYAGYQFSFLSEYKPDQTLIIGSANSHVMVKTPFLIYQ